MKKRKFKKILLILILILIAIFILINTFKIIIFYKIYSGTTKNVQFDNYSMKTKIATNGTEEEVTTYYKSKKGKQTASNGVYLWTNDDKTYIIDEENKIIYLIHSDDENSYTKITNDYFTSFIPGYRYSFLERMWLIIKLNTIISYDKVDDAKCYKISITDQKKATRTYWINKKDYTIKKSEFKIESEIIEYTYDLKFFTANASNLQIPDLTGYKVIDALTNEIITENLTANV